MRARHQHLDQQRAAIRPMAAIKRSANVDGSGIAAAGPDGAATIWPKLLAQIVESPARLVHWLCKHHMASDRLAVRAFAWFTRLAAIHVKVRSLETHLLPRDLPFLNADAMPSAEPTAEVPEPSNAQGVVCLGYHLVWRRDRSCSGRPLQLPNSARRYLRLHRRPHRRQ